jgi:hypothetical protein
MTTASPFPAPMSTRLKGTLFQTTFKTSYRGKIDAESRKAQSSFLLVRYTRTSKSTIGVQLKIAVNSMVRRTCALLFHISEGKLIVTSYHILFAAETVGNLSSCRRNTIIFIDKVGASRWHSLRDLESPTLGKIYTERYFLIHRGSQALVSPSVDRFVRFKCI